MSTTFVIGESPGNGSACQIQDDLLAVTLPVMYSIISLLGFFCNALALWVFYFGTQKKNSITVYMKNLALADLFLALCLPFRAAYQNHSGPPELCKVVGIIFYLTMYVSIGLLSLISLDRYLKIIRPLQQFRIHAVTHSTTASRLVWLLCSATMLPFFFEGREKTGPCAHKCFHFKNRSELGATLNLVAVATFFVLLIFFLYSYGKISLKLHKVSLRKTQQQSKKTSARVIPKTFVVLAIFIICFTPYHVVRVPYILAQVKIISDPRSVQALHLTNELVLCISALNCCFDPVIFFFLSSSFKRAVLAALRGKLKAVFQKNEGVLNTRKSITDSRVQRSELQVEEGPLERQ
ncbi:probable G-protein coupled receptor 34 [Eublepharis macularius]|uniref:Probable G-protein coupled receptor 34 n=1 Tax=Eublepharis macularius TaxID=481883 RepID=A0AA97LE66_EUBMA|nr:probable G-protein coupled receptor 34 [Eublepharis macularius]